MLPVLLLYAIIQGAGGKSSWECIALDGERVPNGANFVPGPDYCSVCKCEEGKPRVCRAVLCQPPQDCMSFRMGNTCCDFICLDDMLPKLPGYGNTDLGLRMVASAITAILSLALLLFLIHRLRQRRLRAAQQQFYEDQLDSPGGPNADSCHSNACCHNAAYCSGNDHVEFFLDNHTPPYSVWKPPSYYLPHQDAPPPYSEVMRSCYWPCEEGSSLQAMGPVLPPGGMAACREGGPSNPHCSALPSCCSPASDNPRQGITLRSDEVYEDIGGSPDDLPPPYYPPTQSLNDLNQGTGVTREAVGGVGGCDCGAADPRCPLCVPPDQHTPEGSTSTQQQQQQYQASVPPVRLRPKERRPPVIQAGERTSALQEFQQRLSMDISDSSTSSDLHTRTFSSLSDDSTSMDASELQ